MFVVMPETFSPDFFFGRAHYSHVFINTGGTPEAVRPARNLLINKCAATFYTLLLRLNFFWYTTLSLHAPHRLSIGNAKRLRMGINYFQVFIHFFFFLILCINFYLFFKRINFAQTFTLNLVEKYFMGQKKLVIVINPTSNSQSRR